MNHPEMAPLIPLMILLIVIPFVLLCLILKIVAMWKICSRAGLSGPLALLMLVPFGDLILPLYVAFTKWPTLEQKPKDIP